MKENTINQIRASQFPTEVLTILNTFRFRGYEAYLVGGAVRDLLLGKTPNDYDIATNASSDKIIELFEDFETLRIGEAFGVVAVIINDQQYEIATFRKEEDYQGRYPNTVKKASTIIEDLERRDFTINSMAFNMDTGLLDPYNGIEDLKRGIIRTVGDPLKRFDEDRLRVLRAFRFQSQLGFEVSQDIVKAIKILIQETGRAIFSSVSNERIQLELNKILMSKNISSVFIAMEKVGLLKVLLPELSACVGFEQYNEHHDLDVFLHTLKALDNIEEKACLEDRLALLFHDLGKVDTFKYLGKGTFYGHEVYSVDKANKILDRLRYSKKTKDKVLKLISNHVDGIDLYNGVDATDRAVRRFIKRVGEGNLDSYFIIRRADILGRNIDSSDKILHLKTLKENTMRVSEESPPIYIKDLAINGRDLLELGVPQSPTMGTVLNILEDYATEFPSKNNKEDLISFLEESPWQSLVELYQ